MLLIGAHCIMIKLSYKYSLELSQNDFLNNAF